MSTLGLDGVPADLAGQNAPRHRTFSKILGSWPLTKTIMVQDDVHGCQRARTASTAGGGTTFCHPAMRLSKSSCTTVLSGCCLLRMPMLMGSVELGKQVRCFPCVQHWRAHVAPCVLRGRQLKVMVTKSRAVAFRACSSALKADVFYPIKLLDISTGN